MRARQPDESGRVVRDGVGVHWERFGDGEPAILLLPTWSIIPSRHWKLQIPYLARRHRVVTFDGRGSGRSDRPRGPAAYTRHEYVADALAVLDATAVERVVLVALARAGAWALQLAADHGDRVLGIVAIAPAAPVTTPHPSAMVYPFDEQLDETAGWAKFNRHYWERDYVGFLRFFFAELFSEPHSTKQIEDGIGWAREVDVETLIDTQLAPPGAVPIRHDELYPRVSCPVLVIHGDEDRLRHHATGVAVAEATGGSIVTIGGGGHGPAPSRPRRCQPTDQGVRRRDPIDFRDSHVGARRPTPQEGPVHLLTDRTRPRPARRRHRRRVTRAPPRPADRLARPTPGDQGARGPRRTCAPGVSVAGQRVGPCRGRVGRT